jgi:phosphoglycerate dehydrogenase-like enzyme
MGDVPSELWEKAEVLYTDRLLPSPDQAPMLRWIQFHYAGVEFAAGNPLFQREGFRATTLSGSSATQVAEYTLMMLLAIGHKLPEMFRYQMAGEWPKDRWERFSPMEMRGATVGLVGYGSIGRQIARLLHPFGAQILAAKRDVMHPEDNGYIIDGIGDPQGDYFTRLYPFTALHSMIKLCDFIILTVPLTTETMNLVDAAFLTDCKPTAWIINPARGGLVDEAALIKALEDNKLGGAVMDVFNTEPLPPDNPLWKTPNVLITPHISGNSQHYRERAVTLFAENLRRYINGIELLNLFDPDRGY